MISESTASKNAALNGRLALLGTGSNPAEVHLYTLPRASSAQAAATGTKLAVCELQATPGSISEGVMTLNPAGVAFVLATGTPGWARVVNGAGGTAFDMDAGPAGSGAECEVSDEVLYAGGTVAILSATMEQ